MQISDFSHHLDFIFLKADQPLSLPIARIGWKIFSYLSEQEQATARFVCSSWKETVNMSRTIEAYRVKLMFPKEVRQEAAHYQSQAASLARAQHFLLTLIKLSSTCHKLQIAAANAFMILKKTGFCFLDYDLKRIQVPGVRLQRTLLDGVNFAEANLSGADLTDCSLRGTCFDKANLENAQFGQSPRLIHSSHRILSMALSPNGKQLASSDEKKLYLWNVETLEMIPRLNEKKIRGYSTEQIHFLLFSHDNQWLFQAYGRGMMEMWSLYPLKKIGRLLVEKAHSFVFLALTQDGSYLVGCTRMQNEGLLTITDFFSSDHQICIWRVKITSQQHLQLELTDKMLIKNCLHLQCALAPQSSILALSFPDSQCIELYSLSHTGKLNKESVIGNLREHGHIRQLLFTSKEDLLVVLQQHPHSPSNVAILSIKNEKITFLFSEHEQIEHLQILSNGQRIAYTTQNGNLCIRHQQKNFALEIREKPPHLSECGKGALWVTDQLFYQAFHNKISIFPLRKFAKRKETGLNASMQTACFSSDERFFYAADNTGKLYAYQSATGKHLFCRTLVKQPSIAPIEHVFKEALFRFSSDAEYLLRSISKGMQKPKMIHAREGREVVISEKFECCSLIRLKDQTECFGLNEKFLACTLSRDNRYLVVAYKKMLAIWDMHCKKEIKSVAFPLHEKSAKIVLSSTVYPKSTLLTRSREGCIKIWKVDWEQELAEKMKEFSPVGDGRFIDSSRLIFQESNHQLVIWDLVTNEEKKIDFGKDSLMSFDINQDGSLMVAIQSIPPHQIKLSLWNLKQKRELDSQLFPLFHSVQTRFDDRSIYLSPHAQYVAYWNVCVGLQKLYVWKIKEGKLHFLWKIPKQLEGSRLSKENARLNPENDLLLEQLKNEP